MPRCPVCDTLHPEYAPGERCLRLRADARIADLERRLAESEGAYNALKHDLTATVERETTELQATCAAMREALRRFVREANGLPSHLHLAGYVSYSGDVWRDGERALSSTAGADLLREVAALEQNLSIERERMDWLDVHCSFVADEVFAIGPYKIGELRQLADDGLAMHASAPVGHKCADCSIDRKPCADCRQARNERLAAVAEARKEPR